jgi:hypothetical protein
MRDEFLRENSDLNGSLHGISQEFPSDMEYLFAPFPSLDNNIWVSYPQIEELLIARLKGTASIAPPHSKISPSVSWRRKPLGVMLELAFQFVSSQFRVRSTSSNKHRELESPIVGFTYSDFDPIGSKFFGKSRYWGDLPCWFADSRKITWVGMGLKPAHDKQYRPETKFGLQNLKAARSYLRSLPTRLRLWRRLKTELAQLQLFGALRSEYFRALFGAPALQAEMLASEFQDLFEKFEPRAVLIPHENQLWERMLSLECSRRGITLAGAIHTTPKFWDLRFFDFGEFSNLQPDFFVDNGKLSRELLGLGKIDDSKLLRGSALRFTHLGKSQKYSRPSGSRPLGRKTLVISGTNKDSAHELISTSLSLQSLADASLSFRPHPSMESWFSRSFSAQKIDARGVESLLDDYELFITESMSSMALELAASGARVCVYLPQSSLNFSPLASLPNFSSYFHDDESLSKLLKDPVTGLEVSELLEVVNSRQSWERIIERLTDHE